jgi:hypothetical protein
LNLENQFNISNFLNKKTTDFLKITRDFMQSEMRDLILLRIELRQKKSTMLLFLTLNQVFLEYEFDILCVDEKLIPQMVLML